MLRAYNGRRRRRRVREQVEHVESESSACTDRRKARYQTMDRQIDYTHFVFDGVRVSHVRIRSGDKCVSSQCSRPLCFIQCLTLLLLAPNIIWLDPISLFVCCWCAFFFVFCYSFLCFCIIVRCTIEQCLRRCLHCSLAKCMASETNIK